ncbi:MAG: DUF1292 domain-containing protein [Lachnospirales bacterium]
MSDLHEHDENCGCGCGHDHDTQYMTLQTVDGEELKCAVIGIFEVEEIEGKEYIALVPEDSDEALIYQYVEDEEGEGFELLNIESDEEFETVEDALMEMLDEEYDEEYDDEEYEFEELDDEE